MASYQVTAPEPFSFSTPSAWPRWKRRFERFLTASGLDKKDEEEQINALIYHMGDLADDILKSFRLDTTNAKLLKKVMDGFDSHFVVKQNIIYERAMFNSRFQQEGETVESFITELHVLSESCNYGTLLDKIIRDRIVVGVRDKRLSEKLQLQTAPTLETAVTTVRQHEAVKKQQEELLQTGKTQMVNYLQQRPKQDSGTKNYNSQQQSNTQNKNSRNKNQSNSKSGSPSAKCKQCGYPNTHKVCPAKEKECNKCKQTGHFAKMCRTSAAKTVGGVTNVSDTFLGVVTCAVTGQDNADREKRWSEVIHVNCVPVRFKLDSGADVTVLLHSFYLQHLKETGLLDKTSLILNGPDGTKLKTVGLLNAHLKFKDNHINEKMYIVRDLSRPLLSVRACEELNLVKRVYSVGEQQTTIDVKKEFSSLFTGLGKISPPYEVKLKPNAVPYALHFPRRVAIPLLPKLKEKLDDMVKLGVIEPVSEATEWCAPMVITGKKSGGIRICVDLSRLNQSVERELFLMPSTEHTLGQLSGGKFYFTIDCNDSFWQIELAPSSTKLTTFITPFGRHCYLRLPFGITSAPEVFQRRMMEILKDISSVKCTVDDIIGWGATIEEHDFKAREVLNRLVQAGLTVNFDKCEFGVTSIDYLGHRIDETGVHPDEKKVEAIQKFEAPTNVSELRSFLGLVNYVCRFIPTLTDILHPLYDLLRKENEFLWGPTQKASFEQLKKILSTHPVLALYNPNLDTIVSADSSSYGLGAVILQKGEDGVIRVVAYASRTLTDTEKRYAQIEKEALASTWACESTKNLDDLTPRLQRFRMRMMRFPAKVVYKPGKEMLVADALSRRPLPEVRNDDFEEEVTAHVNVILSSLPATPSKLEEIKKAQHSDLVFQKVAKFSVSGWPDSVSHPLLKLYWNVRNDISVQQGLIMRGCRIIIPEKMREEVLHRIHSGHLGITKCRARARESVWWPGISVDIENLINRCSVCVKSRKDHHEPLMSSEFPERPWQRVAMDLYKFENYWYLVVIDYFSRFPEVARLESLTSAAVILHCKSIFARHGIPEEIRSDNGPQFEPVRTSEFQQFAAEWGFCHRTSSPVFPQSNGMAEAAVKIVKSLQKKNHDPYIALLSYRSSPLGNGFSPAELLFNRKLRTTVPMVSSSLIPNIVPNSVLREKEESRRIQQSRDYNRHHGVVPEKHLKKGDVVWVQDKKTWGQIKEETDAPRSFIVETRSGDYRRNSYHLTDAHRDDIPNDEVIVDPDLLDTNNLVDEFSERVLAEPPVLLVPKSVGKRKPQAKNAPVSSSNSAPIITRSRRVVKSRVRMNL